MSLILEVKIIKQSEIAPGYFCLALDAPEVAEAAVPGQFLHVRCSNTLDPFLRRPLSIHAVDRGKGEVALLYRAAGRGTVLLSKKREGDSISILGPLGSGFSLPGSNERVFVVAGGIGVAPLYFLLQEMGRLNHQAAVFLGATTSKQLLCVREMKEMGHDVFSATVDGSEGFHGTVVELFETFLLKYFKSGPLYLPGRVYGCGPRGMLKKLCEILQQKGIPGEVSVEERMGCGVGACLSCACKIRDKKNGFRYRRTCVEGPVFPAGEVVWE